jgi:hypothetical protein
MKFLFFLATVLCFARNGYAATGIPGVSDADYAELRALVLPYTYEINKPVTVYNWHKASGEAELNQNSKAPKEYASLEKFAARYWDKQTDPTNTGDLYGTGLYTALDPVATRSYGGNSDEKNWVLTQIRLKPGFRTLDVKRDGGVGPTLDHADLATRLGCPEDWQGQGILDSMVNPAKYMGFPTCAAVIRKLLKDDLKVDGFA